MKKIGIIVALLVIAAITGYFILKNNQQPKELNTSLRLNWLTTCSYAGEASGMYKFAEENGIKLKIDKGGPGLDPLKLVQSGTNTFGVAGADLILAANDKGGDFVIIGVVNYNSPGVWVSKADKNIKSVSDIKPTTRIGELPGGNMIYLYEVFLKKAGLVRNKNFTPVPIPFELKNFIADDECDLRPVFNYEVLPELDMLGIKYNVIEPKNLGIDFKGPAYFCKRETIQKHPELVQKFINTMIEGWQFALQNPKGAITFLKKFDNSVNEEKELKGLEIGKSYFEGYDGKLLNTDTTSFNNMISEMKALGFLSKDVDISKVLDLDFVNNYYEKEKK